MKIPAHRIVFTEQEIVDFQKAAREILESGWMILGKYTSSSKEYAELHGRKYGGRSLEYCCDWEYVEGARCDRRRQVLLAGRFYGVVIPVLRCGAGAGVLRH